MTTEFASHPIGSPDFVARMTADMRTTGWHIHKAHETTINKYQVLGERGCGTNIVRKSMQRTLKIMRTEALGWKHSFPFMIGLPQSFLVVCAVRNPGDWARSLYKRPWHAHPQMQTLDFPAFLRTRWNSIADREDDFENINADLEFAGTEIQWDRHPITGRPFANIFEMRNLKHRALLGLPARGANVVYVQLDAFNAAPEAFLADISAAFHLNPTRRGYAPQTRRMGNAWNNTAEVRHPLPDEWSFEDAQWMHSQLDPQIEDILGFGPD